ncbi:MAG: hypothetical protein D6734_03160 [Candidatus Schekmanbacteria bacterium]|nr:MAG: hypothetical protein D6734_03160 [Candidatus Schekmanbacteria bacterium]
MDPLKKPYLFWDVDADKVDLKRNRNFIIERILSRGDIDDFQWMMRTYGINEVKKVFQKKIDKLDPKSINFFCLYFDIQKPLCTQKQSMKKQNPFWRK